MNEPNNSLVPFDENYEKYYSEEGLMDKLKKFAKKAGISTIYKALLLYYVLQSEDLSAKEKGLIIGALGYLILPVDLIPDSIPGVGFTDDLAVLASVIHIVRVFLSPEIEAQAQGKLKDWFDSFTEDDLIF